MHRKMDLDHWHCFGWEKKQHFINQRHTVTNDSIKMQLVYVIKRVSYNFRADTLFEIWNKYEPRLPKSYYQEKLLEVGDFLMSSKVQKKMCCMYFILLFLR